MHTGDVPQRPGPQKKSSNRIDFGLLQARRTIALFWKRVDVPSLQIWTKDMAFYIVLERLTYFTRGKSEDFEEIWRPLIKFLEKSEDSLCHFLFDYFYCLCLCLMFVCSFVCLIYLLFLY